MPTATPVHPFARFGAGPYTFVGLETTEDRQATNSVAAASGLPFTTNMCGGSCDLCGTAIWNVFTFATAEGRKFKVGCECAEKAGEGHLVREGKRIHRDSQRAEARRERAETERRTREERLESERAQNDAEGNGRLTNDELAAKVVADREVAKQARRDASRHFGTVGQRVKGVELRKEGVYAYESTYGWQRLYFLRRVDNDAAVVWKTSGVLGRTNAQGMWEPIAEGETFVAAFTVTKHDVYTRSGEVTGEQQTKVTRLKVAGPETAPKARKPRETKAAREQRLADAADRKATEARALKQQALDAAHSRATVLRDNLQKAGEGHPYYVENADYHSRILALTELEIAAMQTEMEAL
jgi:hypothetical protein